MRFDTRLVKYPACPEDPWRPLSTPIYQTATFEQLSAEEPGPYDYSRSGNPTRTVLEGQLAALEGGRRAFTYSSGMAALTAVARLVPAGGRIVASEDLYGGTARLLTRVLDRSNVSISFVDTTNLDTVRRALQTPTQLLLVETPSNPLLRVTDLVGVARLAHSAGARLAVDGTAMSPCLQRPLELDADIVIHSATKLLSGHSDLTAGVVTVNDSALIEELAFLQNAEGTALGPFESWLLLRSLKTLSLRLERQQANARRVAEALLAHPLVREVHYPGLPDHAGARLHLRQAHGAGVLVSFETGDLARSQRVVETTRLFSTAVSFGGVGSTISLPSSMSHASTPVALRIQAGLPVDLVRLSVGIEDFGDLRADLEQAFDQAARAHGRRPGAVIAAAHALANEEAEFEQARLAKILPLRSRFGVTATPDEPVADDLSAAA